MSPAQLKEKSRPTDTRPGGRMPTTRCSYRHAERKEVPVRKDRSLWERMYSDPCYAAVVRAVGYQGCLYRDLVKRLQPLVERFGEQRV